jgi:hypothetical protein
MASAKSPTNGRTTAESRPRIAPTAPSVDSTLRLRFWTACLFFAAGLMIVVSVAGFVFLRNLALRHPPVAEAAPPRVTDSPPVEAKPAATVLRKDEGEAIKIVVAPVSTAPKIPASEAAPKPAGDAADVKKSPDPAVAAANRDARLIESVGSLCAVQLYQSYLNVGLLADGVEHEAYSKADAAQILSTIVTLSQTVDGQLQKLADSGLDNDDRKALDRVRKASALVRTQAAHLQSFWSSGEKNHIDDYQRLRQQCWQELRSILGLPEEKE